MCFEKGTGSCLKNAQGICYDCGKDYRTVSHGGKRKGAGAPTGPRKDNVKLGISISRRNAEACSE